MRALAIPVIALALATAFAACSSGSSSSPAPTARIGPTLSAATPSRVPSPGLVREIRITATDALRFEPATFDVARGERVRFVVTNTGTTRHEFFLGDDAAQAEHDAEMQAMGGMGHDEPNGMSLVAGETKTLEFTFTEAGESIAGCHEPGHYAGGMKATIRISG